MHPLFKEGPSMKTKICLPLGPRFQQRVLDPYPRHPASAQPTDIYSFLLSARPSSHHLGFSTIQTTALHSTKVIFRFCSFWCWEEKCLIYTFFSKFGHYSYQSLFPIQTLFFHQVVNQNSLRRCEFSPWKAAFLVRFERHQMPYRARAHFSLY